MSATQTLALGLYDDMANDAYHADRTALSSSGARKLLPPSCPAKFRWAMDHPQPSNSTFDMGSAAHCLVLGAGPKLVVVDALDWRTNDAKAQRDAAYADGATPLLRAEAAVVYGMADAIRRHPIASVLFDPEHGKPEQSLFWEDQRTGVRRKARFDWLPERRADGRLILSDYKTCRDAEPQGLRRSIANFSYHLQAHWYSEGAATLTDGPVAFLFVFQEKDPPYLVTIVELDHIAMAVAERKNRQAIDIFQHCTETDTWPGYSDGIELLALPRWAEEGNP